MPKSNNKSLLPGMEEFFVAEEEEFLFEGVKNTTYFDAALLPDSPSYQTSADGAVTYTLYLVFPDRDSLVRAITALTKRARKGLAAGAKIGTLNGVAIMKDGFTLLEAWERDMLGIKPKERIVEDPDEAQAPI